MSVTTAARVQLDLLGHATLTRDGAAVTLATRNSLLMLARLAVEGRQGRDQLAALLWPNADLTRGQVNLRKTLAYVRDGFGRDVEVVRADGRSLALAETAASDLMTVSAGLRSDADRPALAAAVACWRGELLEGVQADGEVLDAWLAQQRQNWEARLALVCERLIEACSRAGDLSGGLGAAARWLDRDPLSETAHREQIRLHLARGDRAAALAAYHRLTEVLERELGVGPSPETEAVARLARQAVPEAAFSGVRAEPPSEVPLVGRELEFEALVRAFERGLAGESQLVLVAGEAGIGKSRLLREFVAWLTAHGALSLGLAAFPSGRRLAYHAVRPLLDGSSEDSPAALFEAAGARLDGLAGEGLLAVVADDLHWFDADSLDLLEHAASRVARGRRPIVVVAAARDDELRARPTLAGWLGRLARDLQLEEIELGPLAPADAHRLIDLWPGGAGAEARPIVELSGGRPLELVESLRHLAAGGRPGQVAPSIRRSMGERLACLPASAARLAEAAAVLERPASLELLAGVAEVAGDEATALEDLLSAHVLEGVGEYSCSHELMRQTVYAGLPFERRRRLHANARAELAARRAGPAAEQAHHAELAGELDLAHGLRLRAAAEAMALPAYQGAIDQYRAAIAIRAETVEAWLGLGRAEDLAGLPEAAAETYRTLASRAQEAGRAADEAAALVRLAELAGRDLAAAPPLDLLQEASVAAAEGGDPARGVEADLAEAQVLAYRGRLQEAQKLLEHVRRRGTSGRRDLAARHLNLSAFVNQAAGRWQPALELARRAQAAYRRLGEPLMVLDSTGYEGAALVFLGRWQEAARRLPRALERARRLGNPWAVCNLSLVLAWALRDGGRLEPAAAAAAAGVEAARIAGFAPLLALNLAISGRCQRELKRWEAAYEEHTEAWELARTLDGVAQECVAEELAADHAAAGDWPAAAAWAETAVGAWGEMTMFGYLSLWTVAEARLRAGAAFRVPPLPAGDRYRFVELRTKAALADGVRADRYLREAERVARAIDLQGELAQLSSRY